MFLLNSCLDRFSAPRRNEDPLSRSYRVNLPSSLTVNHSRALVYSTQLRVSVCGTGTLQICLADFLGSMITCTIGLYRNTLRTIRFESHGGFACHDLLLHPLTDYSVSRRHCHSYVSTIAPSGSTGILTGSAIGLAVRLILRTRLTLIRLALIRKP